MFGGVTLNLDLPYLYRQRDRKGRWLYYVRRKGKKTRLRGEPGSLAFLNAYNAAMEIETPKTGSGSPGTLKWLCERYLVSAEFRILTPSTQRVRRNLLDKICQAWWEPAEAECGTLPFAGMREKHIRDMRDAITTGPEAANARVKALRRVFAWAVDAGHVERNPALGVSYVRNKTDGFRPWTLPEVERYVKRWPLGTREHLALSLLLYTGASRADVVGLGRGMERAGELILHRKKTGTEAVVPILPLLREAVDACPSGHMTYLVTSFDKPFTANGFGNWFRRKCEKAGCPGRAHGLRKLGASILAEAGASEHELMAIFGWATLKQAGVYTRSANRARMARSGMEKWPTEKIG